MAYKLGLVGADQHPNRLARYQHAKALDQVQDTISYEHLFPADQGDQDPWGACFPAGTLIRMADGSFKAIQDVRTTDQVVTAEGNTGRVLGTMVRDYDDELVEIDLKGYLRMSSMTTEHPVLTKRGYVAAKDLKLGDMVALTRHEPVAGDGLVHFLDYVSVGDIKASSGRARRVRAEVPRGNGGVRTKMRVVSLELPQPTAKMTYEAGWVFGSFLAEGSIDGGKVRWTWGEHELGTHVERLSAYLISEFGLECSKQVRGNHSVNVNLYGADMVKLFQRMFGTGAKAKVVPGQLVNGPIDFIRGVWNGWVDGDGHTNKQTGRVTGTTISRHIALAMMAIAERLGMSPTLKCDAPHENKWAAIRQPVYRLNVSNGDGAARSERDDCAIWHRVVELRRKKFTGVVFNFHVEGDNSYIADGVGVHNCVSFAAGAFIEAAVKKHHGIDLAISRRALYSMSQRAYEPQWIGQDSGLYAADALRTLELNGYVKEADWPYGAPAATFFDPVPASLVHADHRLLSFRRVTGSEDPPAVRFEKAHVAMSESGPLLFGMTWPEDWFYPKGRVLTPKPTGGIAGGHEVLGGASSRSRRITVVRCAWKGYGQNGWVEIPWDVSPEFAPSDVYCALAP